MRERIPIRILLALIVLMGCSRDFDTSVSAESLSQADSLWLNDIDADGHADSLHKYLIQPCDAHVLTCLEEAKGEKSILAGHWNLESDSGRSVFDQSIYENNGTIYNGTWTEGVHGTGIQFDTLGGYVLIESPDFLSIGSKSWTLSAWVKTAYISTDYMDVISRNECGATECNPEHSALYALSIYGQNVVFRLRSNNTNALNLKSSTTNIADNGWHHIVGVLDRKAGKMLLYIDGVLSGSLSAAPLDDIDDNSSPLAIGCMFGREWISPRYYYKGALDELRIYNRALREEEIAALYRGGS